MSGQVAIAFVRRQFGKSDLLQSRQEPLGMYIHCAACLQGLGSLDSRRESTNEKRETEMMSSESGEGIPRWSNPRDFEILEVVLTCR